MSLTNQTDQRAALEVVDVQTNDPRRSDGARTLTSLDKLRLTVNDLLRQVKISARNEDEPGDQIPIIASILPDFENVYAAGGGGHEGYNSANYTLTQATSGTAGALASLGNQMQLAAGAATADQGVNLQSKYGIGPLSGRYTYFGCRVNIKVGTTNFGQMFVGLSNADTTIIASGVMASTDWIGFYIIDSTSAAGTVNFGLYDGVTAETLTTVTTLVKGTAQLLEFVCDGTTAYCFVNRVLVNTITIADLPDATILYPSFVCQAEGTDSVTNDIEWRVFQGTRP